MVPSWSRPSTIVLLWFYVRLHTQESFSFPGGPLGPGRPNLFRDVVPFRDRVVYRVRVVGPGVGTQVPFVLKAHGKDVFSGGFCSTEFVQEYRVPLWCPRSADPERVDRLRNRRGREGRLYRVGGPLGCAKERGRLVGPAEDRTVNPGSPGSTPMVRGVPVSDVVRVTV